MRGFNDNEISTVLSTPPSTVRYWRRKLGLKSRFERKVDPNLFKQLWMEGVSTGEIMKRFNVKPCTLAYWRRKLALPPRRNRLEGNVEEFIELYKEGIPYREIAEKFGVTSVTISIWRRKLGIPARHPQVFYTIEDYEKVQNFLKANGGFAERTELLKHFPKGLLIKMLKLRLLETVVFRRRVSSSTNRGIVREIFDPACYLKTFYCLGRTGVLRLMFRVLRAPKSHGGKMALTRFLKQYLTPAERTAVMNKIRYE